MTHFVKINECEWKEYQKQNNVQTCELLRWRDVKLNEQRLIEAIRKGEFFGIVKASIHFPENTRKKSQIELPTTTIQQKLQLN